MSLPHVQSCTILLLNQGAIEVECLRELVDNGDEVYNDIGHVSLGDRGDELH